MENEHFGKASDLIFSEKDKSVGHVDTFDKGVVVGWACDDESGKPVDLIVEVNGIRAKKIRTKQRRQDLVEIGVSETNRCGFYEEVDVYPFLIEGESNTIGVRFLDTGEHLLGSPLDLPKPDICYNVDKISNQSVQGWIYDKSYTSIPLSLDFFFNEEKIATVEADHDRKDLLAAGHPKSHCGFYLDLSECLEFDGFGYVTAKISETNILAFKEQLTIEPFSAKMAALTELAKVLRSSASDERSRSYEWLLLDLIPSMIKKARKTQGHSLPAKYSGSNIYWGGDNPGLIDVVVPVYKGLEETMGCIDSVIGADNLIDYRLVVINDKSPDNELTLALRDHAEKHNYLLLENEENLGFVGTVNRGMALNPDADIVLLNSDTLVPDGWLDQLSSSAYRDPNIGTVTPFSNNATICSYPNFCQDNEMPEGLTVNDLNKVFKEANSSQIADLPSAHGFCMFIKRAALNEVGLFDEDTWGKGYGEENDFSLRVECQGWRNIMALDTFVQHLGSVSFAENSEQFIAENTEVLNDIYPDYASRIASFVREDPIRPYRNNVAFYFLKENVRKSEAISPAKGKSILFVSLTFGGGTQVATDDMAELLQKEGQNVLTLSSPKPGVWKLSNLGGSVFVEYRWPQEKRALIGMLMDLDVWHIHYHNVMSFDKDIWELPSLLDTQYDVSIHDYYYVCPRANFIDESKVYCGEPPLAACNTCIKRNGVHKGSLLDVSDYGNDVAEWRDYFYDKLRNARAVICPSDDVYQRISRYFQLDNMSVKPHPESGGSVTINPLGSDKIRVAIIGAIGTHKGFDVLCKVADHAEKFELPIEYYVIGYTENDQALRKNSHVKVLGEYERSDLKEIVKDNECHVSLMLSVCPETHGYVLSESLKCGLLPLSFDLGSIGDRIKNIFGEDFVLPLSSSPDQINDKIIKMSDAFEKPLNVDLSKHLNQYHRFLEDYYNLRGE